MKSLIFYSLLVFSLAFLGCTSPEEALKKQAVAFAERDFQEKIRKEAEDNVKQSPFLRQAYYEFVFKKVEFSIEEVRYFGANQATVAVSVTTISPKMRRTLLEIAGKVGTAKSRSFNFSLAADLVEQQSGNSQDPVKQPLGVLKFTKGDDHWILN